MELVDNKMTSNASKLDLLGKITTVFDQLAPLEGVSPANEPSKLQFIENMKS